MHGVMDEVDQAAADDLQHISEEEIHCVGNKFKEICSRKFLERSSYKL